MSFPPSRENVFLGVGAEAGFGPRSVESRLARGAVRAAVLPLRRLTRDFNRWMRGNCSRQPEVLALAQVVGPLAAVDQVRAMARVTLHLWLRIAGGPPVPHAMPTEQAFGAGVADFAAALEALEAAEDVRVDAEMEETLLLVEAVLLRRQIVAVATAYAHAVQGRLRADDPLVASLPELWHRGGRARRRA